MSDILEKFIEEEVTSEQYGEMFDFISSRKVTRGTFIGNYHTVLKAGTDTFIIYREILTPERTLKYQNAVVIGREYLLKKINSAAYSLRFKDIRTISD